MAVAGSLTYKTEIDDKDFDSGLNKLKNAASNAGKVVAGAMAVAGAGIVAIGTNAIQSYAEYEQLIGGVETLFKDSSDIVEGYAKNAYKTAGLSANEYMSTVTSFSASLLQSLNGDTAKSAEVADMAITDMADNANKMGTSMEMIQNAYQGFAKQNYTMLDNLKLGYGGTKTEMERLLADASAISGIKYDINNLNDVYEAIHVIQKEMGIMGATANEAESTIQGSLDSMKSAWSNLVTGIADENADFDTLIQQFVETVITFAENLIPRIITSIGGIGELISGLLESLVPKLAELLPSLIQQFLTIILETIQNLVPVVISLIPQLIQLLLEQLPNVINVGLQILTSLIEGIAEALPSLIDMLPTIIMQIVTTIIDNLPQIIVAGLDILIALIEGIVEAIPQLVDMIPTIIESIITALLDPEMIGKLLEAAIRIIIALATGMVQATPKMIAMIPQIITSIINAFKNIDWGSLGLNIIEGIVNGFSSAGNIIWNAIKSVGNSMISGIKAFFGIASPSKLMRKEIGPYIPAGIGLGVEDGTDEALESIDNMNDEIMREMNKSVDLETGKINANAIVKSNNTGYQVITVVTNVGDVNLDGKKVGQVTTPHIIKNMKVMGVTK